MAVTAQELGRRLRAAREACRMTQDDVARHLRVSRSTVAQMELANKTVTSIELDKLAYLYGRDIREFLAEEFREEDALVALFRRHPAVSQEEEVLDALRKCVALGREVTNLERLLGIGRSLTALAAYPIPGPATKWNAIQQGESAALEDRRRLGLGNMPLPNLTDLLETQGVRTAQVALPDDISGLTLIEPDVGILVVANLRHHFWRRRFSYAHEYGHVLLDREQKGTISRAEDRENLFEVRANAFAAAFLMPAEGVNQFIHGLAKGWPSRLQADVFDEEEALRAEGRSEPGSQTIQLYDVVLLADHFGVSRSSALYRLRNLRLIDATELATLTEQEERGLGREIARLLDLAEPDHAESRNEFRHRFLALALEAFRREVITRRKLTELAEMVGVPPDQLDRALAETGLDAEEGSDALAGGK